MSPKKILSIVLATVLLFSMSAYVPNDVSARSRSKQPKDAIQRPVGQVNGRHKAISALQRTVPNTVRDQVYAQRPVGQVNGRHKAISALRRTVPNTVRDQVYAQRQLIKQNQRMIVSLVQERQTKMQELRNAFVELRQNPDQAKPQRASLIRTRLRTIQENEAMAQKIIKPIGKEQGVTKDPAVNAARILRAQETRIQFLQTSLARINELLTLTR